jgi:hypothetical protein
VGRLAWPALALQLAVLYWPRQPELAQIDLPGADKAVHAAVFALAVWAWVARVGRAWLVGGLFAANAVVSELVQGLVLPQRSGDPWDAAADLAGLALGLLLAAWTARAARAAPGAGGAGAGGRG